MGSTLGWVAGAKLQEVEQAGLVGWRTAGRRPSSSDAQVDPVQALQMLNSEQGQVDKYNRLRQDKVRARDGDLSSGRKAR